MAGMQIHIFRIPQNIRSLRRLRQIVNVLIKHGFGHVIDRLRLRKYLPFRKRIFRSRQERLIEDTYPSVARRICLVLEELGPTFIKLGQLLSSRPDLVPPELVRELKNLQDRTNPFPYEAVRATIEEDFSRPLEKLFVDFEPEAFASASVAQAHRASLPTGEKVVVKVKRPDIDTVIETDLDILISLARLVEKYMPESRIYNPTGVVNEFSRSIRKELDFTIEAFQTDRFFSSFKDIDGVRTPRVYWEYTSPRVLTLETIDGIRVDEVEKIESLGLDKKEIARRVVDIFMKQIFEFGFFHADPHSGNLFVLPSGDIALVDFGIVGRLDREVLLGLARIMVAVNEFETEKVIEELLRLDPGNYQVNVKGLRRDIVEFIDQYFHIPVVRIQAENFIHELISIAGRHGVRLPPDFVLLAKTFLIIGGMAHQLDADFNIMESVRPFARRLLVKRMHPQHLIADLSRSVYEIAELVRVLPGQLSRVMNHLQEGKITVKVSGNSFQSDDHSRQNGGGKHLALGFICAALLIASSIIITASQNNDVFFSMAIGGYILAAFLGLVVLRSEFF